MLLDGSGKNSTIKTQYCDQYYFYAKSQGRGHKMRNKIGLRVFFYLSIPIVKKETRPDIYSFCLS